MANPSAQMKGSAVSYHRLAFRAVSQRELSFFVDRRRRLLEVPPGPRFGLEEGGVFEPGSYDGLASLVSHGDWRNDVNSFWIVLSACFNLRKLHSAGYFGVGGRNKKRDAAAAAEEQKFVARLLVRFLELLQFNTHSVIEQVRKFPAAVSGFFPEFPRDSRNNNIKAKCFQFSHGISPDPSEQNRSKV